uniref:Unc-45 myosin chaperone A n=1 Tax=Gasterosteus aculeatus aculeatus TaxID=481459 RepID=A0AAQ4Q9L4_GASAC
YELVKATEFKCNQINRHSAVCCYTKAIKRSGSQAEKAVLYRNRSAYPWMWLHSNIKCDVCHSFSVLNIDPGDVKARFRRAQAFQKLCWLDQAFLDAQRCAQLEPKNKAFHDLLRQIAAQIQQKLVQQNSTDSRVQQMFSLLVDASAKDSDRQKAAQNLVVLTGEDAGAEQILRNDGVKLIQKLLQSKQKDIVLSSLRTLVGMCTGHQSRVRLNQLCAVMGEGASTVSLAACHLLQVMFEALTEGMKKEIRGKDEAILPEPSKELRSMLRHLMEMMPASNVSGPGRDSAINLLIKQVPRKSMKNPDNSLTLWVIDQGTNTPALDVAGTVPELSEGPTLNDNSHISCSVLLSKLYDDLKSDAERENFNKLCEEYVQQHFSRHGLDGKLQAIQTVSVLLQGPSDVGNRTLEMSGMMDAVIALCASEDATHQQVAVETVIHKKPLIKDLHATLVVTTQGLCKLGSAGGTDFSMKQFAEGSTLARQAVWLCNESLPPTTRRWSVEGLAYLTFDADVKEDLVEDKNALLAMFELAKSEDKTVLFAVGSTLVNCTNSYEVEKPDPQMVKLAKYAKQHVPEEHPKVPFQFLIIHIEKLLETGVVSALVCMVKQESPALTEACRDCIARVFLALVERQEDRGTVVAQGGGKALIPLASDNTDVGKIIAAQALAKITITSNPEIAFPGERVRKSMRWIGPLVSILSLECTLLQNFEALMALTNLAGISERLRQKIIKEKAVPKIEGYMFEEHDLVQKLYLATGNDRLKLLVLYSGEDDERLRKAAAGTLAMLTAEHKHHFLFSSQTTHWLEIIQSLLLCDIPALCHRGVVIVHNMMQAEKSLAETIMESEALEILSVLAKGGEGTPQPVSKVAQSCLEKAVEYSIIMTRDGKGTEP